MSLLSRNDPHHRILRLEQTIENLNREVAALKQELKSPPLTREEVRELVDNLSDLQKRVHFIDPKIREVFLDLTDRIRRAERLVERLDGKLEKNKAILPYTSE